MLSVGVDETRQTAVNWRETYGLTSPVMIDPTGDMYDPYSLGLFPLNVILDETNTIRYQEIHFNEFEIRSLLSELSDPLVKIDHSPLLNTEDNSSDFTVTAVIRSGDPLVASELRLYWETDDTSGEVLLVGSGADMFSATIPRQDTDTQIRYYISAQSSNGRVAFHPNTAPDTMHTFRVLIDSSPPQIDHIPHSRWRGDLWSPKITARITDDLTVTSAELEFRINGGSLIQVPMSPVEHHEWQVWFTSPAVSGDRVEYRIRAVDSAVGVNVGMSPGTDFYEMTIIDPIPALVLDLDGNQNSGPVIRDALTGAGVFTEYAMEWPENFNHYRSLWINLGTGDTSYPLTLDESMILEAFMESGNPVYLECGNCWHNPGRFNSINLFNARSVGDTFAITGLLEGLDDTLGHGLVFEYSGDPGGVTPLTAVSRSESIFQSVDPEFIAAIASQSEAGRTVASTFEIGGLMDGPGDGPTVATRQILVERYADFFGLIDLAPCELPAVTLDMPSEFYQSGDLFKVDLTLCNPEFRAYTQLPLFVILDIQGALFFWPSFTEFDYQLVDLSPGEESIRVIDPFNWPNVSGSGSGAWYAAMTDPDITEIFGEFDTFEFGW